MIPALSSGFALGLGLILAIGAQNAFVLRQGIRREHVLVVVLICAVSDAFFVAAGVSGIGWAVESLPWARPLLIWGGAAFLLVYGVMSFRRAIGPPDALLADGEGGASLKSTVLTCLALTWLNPHVYLDTLVLLGSIASTFGPDRWYFGIGAVIASFVFFFSLGFGARFLAPIFKNPTAWRVLDFCVGVIMWGIAVTLVLS